MQSTELGPRSRRRWPGPTACLEVAAWAANSQAGPAGTRVAHAARRHPEQPARECRHRARTRRTPRRCGCRVALPCTLRRQPTTGRGRRAYSARSIRAVLTSASSDPGAYMRASLPQRICIVLRASSSAARSAYARLPGPRRRATSAPTHAPANRASPPKSTLGRRMAAELSPITTIQACKKHNTAEGCGLAWRSTGAYPSAAPPADRKRPRRITGCACRCTRSAVRWPHKR